MEDMAGPMERKYFSQEKTNGVFGKKLGARGQERKEIMHKVVFDLSGSAFNRKKSRHYLLSRLRYQLAILQQRKHTEKQTSLTYLFRKLRSSSSESLKSDHHIWNETASNQVGVEGGARWVKPLP